MKNSRKGVLVFSIFMIATMVLSACTQSLSNAPAATPTVIPTGLFVSPIASVENPMAMIEEFAKQTAAAQTSAAGGAAPTTPEAAVVESVTPGTPLAEVPSATPTVNVSTPTNASGSAVTSVPSTSVPVGVRPTTYELKTGEFPYCIARRYDVDPDQLLSLSGLTSTEAYNLSAGTKLSIPQSGSFPGSRALQAHPASYTVTSSDETVYSIACKYGDVMPENIISGNGLTGTNPTLAAGTVLKIP